MIIQIFILFMATLFMFDAEFSSRFEIVNYLFRSLQHANLYHLIANMYALWNLKGLSESLGTFNFLLSTTVIWLISSLILYIIHQVMPTTKKITVGFSGVLLGLTLINQYQFTDLNLASTELLKTILPHFFIPGISFWGHFSGLIAGIIYVLGRSNLMIK